VGVGLFAPYGLQTRWPLTFDGRFSGYDNKIKTFYVQPTVAYQVTKWLKLGGGVDVVHGSVALHQRVDLAAAPVPGVPGATFGAFGIPVGTDVADADLEASTTSYGGHFGAIAQVSPKLSIGAHYLMKVDLDYSGTATFTQVNTGIILPATITIPGVGTIPAGTPLDGVITSLGLFATGGPLAAQTATATIANPDMFVGGVAFKATEKLTLLADYQWVHWATFGVLNLKFSPDSGLNQTLTENYTNTSGVRVGAEYETSPQLTVRGGYLYHQGAAPPETVTPLLPEGARNEFTGGLTVHIGKSLTGDFAYQYIRQNDRRGRTQALPNNGLYTFGAHLFGVSLAFTF
jgi:long-chain fatty acid transport protein